MKSEAGMIPQLSYLTLSLITVTVYFVWMDVALYINLQQVQPLQPESTRLPAAETNKTSEIVNAGPADISFSLFYPLSIKLIFQGPTIHYVDEPLSYWTMAYTNIARVMSANVVSFIGVLFAAAACKMFMSESLHVRQLGVLLFKVRDYLDSLDGWVARARANQVHINPDQGSFGSIVDGTCDGVADVMMLVAIFFLLYRNNVFNGRTFNRGYGYLRLDAKQDLLPMKVELNNINFWRRALPIIVMLVLMGGQTIVSTVFWNVNMMSYHKILETDMYASTEAQHLVQNEALKSSTMWIIIYFWRLFNPHNLNQFILLAILYNKTFEFCVIMQFWGYLPLITLSLVSYIYAKVTVANIMAAATTVAVVTS